MANGNPIRILCNPVEARDEDISNVISVLLNHALKKSGVSRDLRDLADRVDVDGIRMILGPIISEPLE